MPICWFWRRRVIHNHGTKETKLPVCLRNAVVMHAHIWRYLKVRRALNGCCRLAHKNLKSKVSCNDSEDIHTVRSSAVTFSLLLLNDFFLARTFLLRFKKQRNSICVSRFASKKAKSEEIKRARKMLHFFLAVQLLCKQNEPATIPTI